MAGPRREPLNTNLGILLERQAWTHGDRTFVIQAETGASLTYGAFNEAANRAARGFAALGAARGHYVCLMLPNEFPFLQSSYALKKIGAVEVAINREFRGIALGRMLRLTRSPILVTSREYLEPLHAVREDLEHVEHLVMVDGAREAADLFPDKATVAFDQMLADSSADLGPVAPDTDVAVILFTSGTTGVSKGCPLSHRSAVRAAECTVAAFDLTGDDCVYSPYPLFHVGAAHYDILPALLVGGRAIIRRRFSVSAFWPEVARHGATWAMMLGSTQQLLWAAAPRPEETAHGMRLIWGTPLPVDPEAFEARFRVRVARGGGYGSTDAGAVAMPLMDRPGGRVLDHCEVGIVGEDDEMLPAGAVGELVVREREPGVMSEGYFGMPEATRESRRNGWFHTGDLARLDDAGHLHFVGRMSERIRVLGEMVSAYEVEETLMTHPAVEDCAVIGVPAGDGEELLKAFVTLRAGGQATRESLSAYAAANMSRYMVPTLWVFLEDMPRTPSGKPSKAELRAMS